MYPSYRFGWLQSVTYVSLLSLWALVETAFSAWRADENPDSERLVQICLRLERIEEKVDTLCGQEDKASSSEI
jgi:hypothetical protein